MNIYQKIKDDHDHVKKIYVEIEGLDRNQGQKLKELFEVFVRALSAHNHAEEETFYGFLKGESNTHKMVSHRMEEHEQVESLLAKIESLEPSDDAWHTQLHGVIRKIIQHMTEEEGEVFDFAKKVITPHQGIQLGQDYDHAKAIFKGSSKMS